MFGIYVSFCCSTIVINRSFIYPFMKGGEGDLLMHDKGSRFPAFDSLQLALSSAPFSVLLDPG